MKSMKSAFTQSSFIRPTRSGLLAIAAIMSMSLLGGAINAHAQSSDSLVPKQREKEFPVGTSWVALSLDNKNYPAGAHRPFFVLDSQYQLRGFGGCNTFSATAYPLRNQGFAVSPFAVTRKSCGAQIDAAERAFLLALRMSQKWDVVKGILVLQGSSGTIRADRSL